VPLSATLWAEANERLSSARGEMLFLSVVSVLISAEARNFEKISTVDDTRGRWRLSFVAAGNISDSKRIFAMIVMIVLAGCGVSDGLTREPVSGEVTLDGLPLRDGTILLEPLSPGVGTAVGGTIRRGHFEIDRSRGPVAGDYRARIYARSDIQAPARPGSSVHKPRPLVELIPEIYNVHSTLRSQVVRDNVNVIRFDLRTAGPDK
jgi:hypothetical protein